MVSVKWENKMKSFKNIHLPQRLVVEDIVEEHNLDRTALEFGDTPKEIKLVQIQSKLKININNSRVS